MAINIQKPKKGKLPTPPMRNAPKITNLTKRGSKDMVTLNLRVTAEFRRDVKLYATSKDRSIVDTLKSAFLEYKQRHM